ncbi:MAG: hypothetical protein HRT42_09890 [Campylobacteraceae bacterium]|nr:hypothetical protein [Campylobacteraceae bacterium]
MKKILILICISIVLLNANGFIHPLDFKGSKVEKEKVMNFIVKQVKETYSKIGMGDPSTLRMMEKQELSSFKQLTKVQNRQLLDSVITQYCNIGMCNYNTILMMYNEQNKASKEKLNW